MQHLEHGALGQRQGHLGNAHLARLAHDARQRQFPVVDRILNELAAHRPIARRGVHHRIRLVLPRFQRRQHSKGLDRGAGLVGVGHGAVAHSGESQLKGFVRVVGRGVDHGQNLPRAGIENDDGSRCRPVPGHRILELPIGKVLQAQIDAERDVLAEARCGDVLQITDGRAEPVLEHDLAPVLAAQQIVESQFDAFEAAVVNVGDTHHVGGGLGAQIVAPVLFAEVQALDPQGADALRSRPRKPPLQIDESLVRMAVQMVGQLRRIPAQQGCQAVDVGAAQRSLARVAPDGHHRRADRQRLVQPVVYDAPAGRDDDFAHRAGVPLILQEVLVQQSQVNHPGGKCCATRHKQAEHGMVTPDLHRGNRSTRSGKRIPNWVSAICSTL